MDTLIKKGLKGLNDEDKNLLSFSLSQTKSEIPIMLKLAQQIDKNANERYRVKLQYKKRIDLAIFSKNNLEAVIEAKQFYDPDYYKFLASKDGLLKNFGYQSDREKLTSLQFPQNIKKYFLLFIAHFNINDDLNNLPFQFPPPYENLYKNAKEQNKLLNVEDLIKKIDEIKLGVSTDNKEVLSFPLGYYTAKSNKKIPVNMITALITINED